MNRSEELELQYSPSRWSKRYSAEEVIQKHIEFITKASFDAKKSIPCELDIPYGPTAQEKMDVFGTNLPADSPIFIYIHGGYWQELNRELSSYVVAPLIKYKFKVIILGYSLCPSVTLKEIVQQIHKAFLKCVEYAKSNGSRRLYIGGHSAGAHLAASLFRSNSDIIPRDYLKLLKGVILISGLYDLTPLTKTYINTALKLDSKTAQKLSHLHHKLEINENIPFFIIVGENDSPAFIQQSQAFHKKLKNAGNNSKLIIVREVDHFDIVERLNEDSYEIVKVIVDADEDRKDKDHLINGPLKLSSQN